MQLLTLGTDAVECAATPFSEGFNAIALNFGSADATINGSDTEDGTYSKVVTVPTGGAIDTGALPKFIKASASVELIG
jgi:hypothetical protein